MSVEGPIQPDRICPYSGLTILRCKRSDLCDCFDFPEHDRALLEETTMSETPCRFCGEIADGPVGSDGKPACQDCASIGEPV